MTPIGTGQSQRRLDRLSDAELVLGLCGDDSQVAAAMSVLYHRHARWLHGLGFRLLGDRNAAEELVQETFVRLWRSADRYEPNRGSVRTWLASIARNLAIDLHRRDSRRPHLELTAGEGQPVVVADLADIGDAFDRLAADLAMAEVLGRLADPHRQVMALAFRDGLTQNEIAARLGVPVGTVKSRMFNALRTLRQDLNGEPPVVGGA